MQNASDGIFFGFIIEMQKNYDNFSGSLLFFSLLFFFVCMRLFRTINTALQTLSTYFISNKILLFYFIQPVDRLACLVHQFIAQNSSRSLSTSIVVKKIPFSCSSSFIRYTWKRNMTKTGKWHFIVLLKLWSVHTFDSP